MLSKNVGLTLKFLCGDYINNYTKIKRGMIGTEFFMWHILKPNLDLVNECE